MAAELFVGQIGDGKGVLLIAALADMVCVADFHAAGFERRAANRDALMLLAFEANQRAGQQHCGASQRSNGDKQPQNQIVLSAAGNRWKRRSFETYGFRNKRACFRRGVWRCFNSGRRRFSRCRRRIGCARRRCRAEAGLRLKPAVRRRVVV
ncbi:hypothetical protein SDC9_109937 [bioreactor metagenome]|uniref:Uncharacterized protein n=1 Tax=bioreactor metagenome TaxID=1076179 RepID=A0A645BC51_9ZZZZ